MPPPHRAQVDPATEADAAQALAIATVRSQRRAGMITALIGTPILLAAYVALVVTVADGSKVSLLIIFGAAFGPLIVFVGASLWLIAIRAATLTDARPDRYRANSRTELVGRRRSKRPKTLVLLADPDTGAPAGGMLLSDYDRWQGLPDNSTVYCWGTPRGGNVAVIASLELNRAHAGRISQRTARRWLAGQ